MTIDQDRNITTSGNITCLGNLSAPNIYTKGEVNFLYFLFGPKATTVYVDDGLWLKANKADV